MWTILHRNWHIPHVQYIVDGAVIASTSLFSVRYFTQLSDTRLDHHTVNSLLTLGQL